MKIEIKKGTIKVQGAVIEFESGTIDVVSNDFKFTELPREDFNFKAHAGAPLGVRDEGSKGDSLGDPELYALHARSLVDSGIGLSRGAVDHLRGNKYFNVELHYHNDLWYNKETRDKLVEDDNIRKLNPNDGVKEPYDNPAETNATAQSASGASGDKTLRPKIYNDFIDLIRKSAKKSASRADLEKATGCSKPTSGNVVNYLKRDGVIVKVDRGEYALADIEHAVVRKSRDYHKLDLVMLKPVPFVDEENDNICPDEWMLEPGKRFVVLTSEEGSDMVMLGELSGHRKSLAYKHWLQ